MTARRLSAQEAFNYHLVNKISASQSSVVDEAIDMAAKIGSFSPDAVIITRHGLREAWESPSVEQATAKVRQDYGQRLREGENFKIGVTAFATKSRPEWVPSKL